MSFMTTYKPGQGRQARAFANILYVFVIGWGCYAFFEYGNSKLDRFFGRIFDYQNPFFGKPINQLMAGSSTTAEGSAMTAWMTPSFVLSALLFLFLLFWGRRTLNKPSKADHLIGTELELRRVNWPQKEEVARSGTMVVYYTFWLAVIIFAIDLLMNTFVGMLLGQRFEEVGLGKILEGIFGFFGGK